MTSTLKADTLQASTTNGSVTLKGDGTGSVLLPSGIAYSANVTGNVSITRSLAVGYTDGRIPRANLEVKGNTHITGATTIEGAITTGATTTLGGAIAGADNQVGRVNLIDYGEVTNAIGSVGGGAQTIDLTLGNNIVATIDTGATTFTFSNPTASDELCGFTLFLTNGGSQTVNWPSSVDWAGGTAPTLTSSGLDILVFITTDGGTIWHGMVASADSKSP